MSEAASMRKELVVNFRSMLAGGVQVSELLARGFAPDLVEAAATGVRLVEIERRNSQMPPAIRTTAVGESLTIL
ncbi:hypothetical protein COS78_00180 [Candidatus Shapirobacteria bacterium CG06_land_8_20_14_3_00_40_12]|uniref:Uncharacterized protein n=2 Tax=Candidatus Shapironibacteriota TaxID=1752721 RepID=A0A2M7TRH3_9BACT|nr:MAG: hypothetical protein COS78_00180 [Candidatus Shapirobacteria bacterium CG06_land_8_20_14_3_00_40_12]PIZ57925.1 MAG: hypothetical protein COY20_04475 [Candidatus Shapirobacteria bacterium CG_4_10_14_0_2_um_filter_40_12]